MGWLVATGEFVYDFLADDGWELLVGLAIILPLTHFAAEQSDVLALVVLVGGILVTLAISLARKLPARKAA